MDIPVASGNKHCLSLPKGEEMPPGHICAEPMGKEGEAPLDDARGSGTAVGEGTRRGLQRKSIKGWRVLT